MRPSKTAVRLPELEKNGDKEAIMLVINQLGYNRQAPIARLG